MRVAVSSFFSGGGAGGLYTLDLCSRDSGFVQLAGVGRAPRPPAPHCRRPSRRGVSSDGRCTGLRACRSTDLCWGDQPGMLFSASTDAAVVDLYSVSL